MKYMIATAAISAAAGTVMSAAQAQDIRIKPVAEARLRYEHADQEGLAIDKSDALTIRARAGLAATSGALSATVIGQGNLAVVDRYYDGLNGAANRPIIADPENVALYIAQLQYKTKLVTLTGGRQRIALVGCACNSCSTWVESPLTSALVANPMDGGWQNKYKHILYKLKIPY